MSYKVVGFTNTEHTPRSKPNHNDLDKAFLLREEFGLPFSLEDVYKIWSSFSYVHCTLWLVPDQESIESAFGVILEEA